MVCSVCVWRTGCTIVLRVLNEPAVPLVRRVIPSTWRMPAPGALLSLQLCGWGPASAGKSNVRYCSFEKAILYWQFWMVFFLSPTSLLLLLLNRLLRIKRAQNPQTTCSLFFMIFLLGSVVCRLRILSLFSNVVQGLASCHSSHRSLYWIFNLYHI